MNQLQTYGYTGSPAWQNMRDQKVAIVLPERNGILSKWIILLQEGIRQTELKKLCSFPLAIHI